MKTLASFFSLRRRYARSVNLERDLAEPDSLRGYAPTPRAIELLERILAAQAGDHSMRAWTLTGVYGTGKSACAHLLLTLHAPADDPARSLALEILRGEPAAGSLAGAFEAVVPATGLVRAVATGRREPLARTVVRALACGAEAFWASRPGPKPRVLRWVLDLRDAFDAGAEPPDADVAGLVQEVASASGAGVLLVLDELGKTLEHAAGSAGASDLYLLQQLAELPARKGEPPVLVLGLLHQSFAEYGQGLASAERAEWDKIQGRFEDVVFAEAPEHMLRLVGQAIEAKPTEPMANAMRRSGEIWQRHFRTTMAHPYVAEVLPAARIAELFPLHPVTALVLPTLCQKYAQNDRSLFTFLTSQEPHSLARFLAEQAVDADADEPKLPLLRLPELYDYLLDIGGVSLTGRGQFQRWAEIHSLIRDAAPGLVADELAALKAIGTLNLVTSTGPLRASRAMVLASLVERPDDETEMARWSAVLDHLEERRLLTHRRQIDEIRIWEGSEFDIGAAVRVRMEAERRPLAELLRKHVPLSPIVAKRHSYRTGTLRYFERQYAEDQAALDEIRPSEGADGVIVCWVSDSTPERVPETAVGGCPLVLVRGRHLSALRSAATEFAVLADLSRAEPAIQNDGVAKRELRERLVLARRILEQALRDSFDLRATSAGEVECWVGGERWRGGTFNAALSALCDCAYHLGPVLWNELLNRRELTSQGARARRELIEAILEHHEEERLGLSGHGPEVSMYESLLLSTGIHRPGEFGSWIIGPPREGGISGVWSAIEDFFFSSTEEPRSLDGLYALLDAPPYGVKEGMIPVLIAAALFHHSDDVSLYRDRTFLPVLGAEQFEVLVKQPERFAVKYLQLRGLRLDLFRELEAVLSRPEARAPARVRNATLLGVVRPLVRFATSLPVVTARSGSLGEHATAVRDALLNAREPDRLIFETLPRACGFAPFRSEPADGETRPAARQLAAFRRTLLRALAELQTHYERVLDRCRTRLHEAFGVSADEADVREHLRVRAQYLVGRVIEPRLRSFVLAAVDEDAGDREWIEAIAMIVADRPVEKWTDEDALAFEANLGDLARRFANVEALQREAAAEQRDGFDARRVTITRPDGRELHRLVWLNRNERELVEARLSQLLEELDGLRHEHQRHAVAVALVERLLAGAADAAEPARRRAPGVPPRRRSTGGESDG